MKNSRPEHERELPGAGEKKPPGKTDAPSRGGGGFRQLGDLLSIGWNLAVSIGVGLGLGLLVDRWLGTQPWGLLVFLLLGIAAGFLNLFRLVSRLEKNRRR